MSDSISKKPLSAEDAAAIKSAIINCPGIDDPVERAKQLIEACRLIDEATVDGSKPWDGAI